MFKQVLLLIALFGILNADWVETKNVELGPNESVSSAYHHEYENTVKNMKSYINITLNDEAQMHAKLNALNYKYDATLGCYFHGPVYFDREITIRCYDKDEKELDGCSYTVDESDPHVGGAPVSSDSYNTGILPVPADTKYIKVFTSVLPGNVTADIDLDVTFKLSTSLDSSSLEDNSQYDLNKTFNLNFNSDGFVVTDDTPVAYSIEFYDVFADDEYRVTFNDLESLYKYSLLSKDSLFYWSQLAYQIFGNGESLSDDLIYDLSTNGLKYTKDSNAVWNDFSSKYSLSDEAKFDITGNDIFYTYADGYLIIFYDFVARPIVDTNVYTLQEGEPVSNISYTVTQNNANTTTNLKVDNEWTYTDSFTNTVTNSTTHTKSMTHGWDAALSFKFNYKGKVKQWGVDITGGVMGQYTTGDTVGFEDTNSASHQVTQTSESGINVILEPYTVGKTTTKITTISAIADYPMPIEFNYKVAFVSSSGSKTYIFGQSNLEARNDLKQRALVSPDYNGDNVDWLNILTAEKPNSKYQTDKLLDGEDIIKYLTSKYPITYAKAIANYDANQTDYAVDVYPSQDLAYTKITEIKTNLPKTDTSKITLSKSDLYDITNNISVNGYNAQNGKYYGFSQGNGSWIITDLSGKSIDPSIAKIYTNSANKHTYLEIGANASASNLSLIYVINKDTYKAEYASNKFINQDNLTNIASTIVEIK
ncbi:hypothetical protein [Campylobacter vicugnae]|uniref:hypothetical protein n=1 Tax=Campylobacter vicugnae TaxID=1660076 RepID=UPI000A3596C6|nr:hypothetical protein [Campylobacter sp. S0112]